MKQLTCEMCGGTDIVKEEGNYICQNCGTKYSVEEAKKMMIEGTVDVSGSTVKVDDSDKLNNIVINAKNTYNSGNYSEAYRLFSEALNIDPNNTEINYWRSLSMAMQSSVANFHVADLVNNTCIRLEDIWNELGDTPSSITALNQVIVSTSNVLMCLGNLVSSYYEKATPRNITLTGAIVTSGVSADVFGTAKNRIQVLASAVCTITYKSLELFEDSKNITPQILRNLSTMMSNLKKAAKSTTNFNETVEVDLLYQRVNSKLSALEDDGEEETVLYSSDSVRWGYGQAMIKASGLKGHFQLTNKRLTFVASDSGYSRFNSDIRYSQMRNIELVNHGGLLKLTLKDGNVWNFCVFQGLSQNKQIYGIISSKLSNGSPAPVNNAVAGQKTGGCYVATCVYGSYDCPQVWTLRRYRDNNLSATWYGRAFVRTYYAISPTLVKWFGNTNWFKNMWKPTLDRMVEKLQSKGMESTPYQDKKW